MVSPITPISPRRLMPASPVSAITPYAGSPFQNGQNSLLFNGSSNLMKHMLRAAESAAEWLTAAGNAGDSAKQLHAGSSLWQKRGVTSSNEEAVTGQAADGAKKAAYRIQIDSLAASQTNRSFELAKNGSSVIEAGQHAFRLSTDGKSKTLNVNIGANDTNAQALSKLRDAINGSDMGIKAELTEDKSNGTVRLDIQSEATGTKHAFTLEDVEGSAVSATGIADTAKEAKDAVYRLNGGDAVTQSSNTVKLDQDRVKLDLKAVTSRDVEVKVGLDADAVVAGVKQAVQDANKLAGVYGQHAGFLNPSILRSFDQAMTSGSADRLGIERSGSGWKLNEDELRTAIEQSPDAVMRDLTGPGGWAAGVSKAADRYSMMPVEALLSPAARGMATYSQQYSLIQLNWMTPSSGWFVNTLF